MNFKADEAIKTYTINGFYTEKETHFFYNNGLEFIVEKDENGVVYACWYHEDNANPIVEITKLDGINEETVQKFFDDGFAGNAGKAAKRLLKEWERLEGIKGAANYVKFGGATMQIADAFFTSPIMVTDENATAEDFLKSVSM